MWRLCFLFILQNFCFQSLSAQNDIVKNGIKINRLDKKKRKQGQWFFFDNRGDLALSCDYKNDTLYSALTYYQGKDTAFIRYPRNNDAEIFILYFNNRKVIGNHIYEKDTSRIQIIGTYHQVSKDSFDIREDLTVQNSSAIIDSAKTWFDKKIFPLYMFGNGALRDFLYGGFHGSDFIFNKPIYAEITIDESGIVRKVDFPRMKNSLTFYEEQELNRIYSGMPRWQPYVEAGKTWTVTFPYTWSVKLDKVGTPIHMQ